MALPPIRFGAISLQCNGFRSAFDHGDPICLPRAPAVQVLVDLVQTTVGDCCQPDGMLGCGSAVSGTSRL